MSLFPEIPLAPFLDPQNGSSPALEPGGTSGIIPGLEQSLLQLLQSYRPGDIGICEVFDKFQITLPLTDWDWYGWCADLDTTMAAGETDPEMLWTVPPGERAWVDAVTCERTSGDNKFSILRVNYPAAYSEGDGVFKLTSMATADSNIWWPDPAGKLVENWVIPNVPILLEQGAAVEVVPTGDGVSSTVFTTRLLLRRTKIGKARTP